jgi:hypothetical protein
MELKLIFKWKKSIGLISLPEAGNEAWGRSTEFTKASIELF